MTAFYAAKLVGLPNPQNGYHYEVEFHDDIDETGKTPRRLVKNEEIV
eukprot:CAMPEP_0117429702 /NCGR_PEP_ID=MMETSP0758-20121206/9224_1 /TAXON_ID=63605 /ORGANISM="Percolomonas cosmopolitus, Strain AE-1 (ATCC 50343)" /LENGTH=46 /DNA_ID= /DNA_START= /DNA_END= /DNA_ORIENTATION=